MSPSVIYLDANATTPSSAEVNRQMIVSLRQDWANPSSSHSTGRQARRKIDDARLKVANLLGAVPSEIIFTSGGTESNNLAIQSAIAGHAGRHIVTSTIEHPSVEHPIAHLEQIGYSVTRVPVIRSGIIDLERFRAALRPGHTALATVMWANNETGVIQPVKELAQAANDAGAFFFTDAVQAAGKLNICARNSGIHFLSISGHKMYGPKGVGALFVAQQGPGHRMLIHPMILGGGQERSHRSGTENVPGIVGLGAAAVEATFFHADEVVRLRNWFEESLKNAVPSVQFIGQTVTRVCNSSLFRIPGKPADILTHKLDRLGIQVSSGSACHSGRTSPSKVLLAMGLHPMEAREAVRVSLTHFTTAGEIDTVVAAIKRLVL